MGNVDMLIILMMVTISCVQILGHEVVHLKCIQWEEEKEGEERKGDRERKWLWDSDMQSRNLGAAVFLLCEVGPVASLLPSLKR